MESPEKVKSGKFLQLIERRNVLESETNALKEQAFSTIPEISKAWQRKEFQVVWESLIERGTVTRVYEEKDIGFCGFQSLEAAKVFFGELAEAWKDFIRVDIAEFGSGKIAVHFVVC